MIKRGDMVRLVDGDGFMPPLLSVGTVVSAFDEDGDADVYFPGYPCPVPPGTSWVAHRSWLRKIDPDQHSTELAEQLTA